MAVAATNAMIAGVTTVVTVATTIATTVAVMVSPTFEPRCLLPRHRPPRTLRSEPRHLVIRWQRRRSRVIGRAASKDC